MGKVDLDELIRRSQDEMDQDQFGGWKGTTISFLADSYGAQVAEEFKAVCGKAVHEIGPAREFLKDLRVAE